MVTLLRWSTAALAPLLLVAAVTDRNIAYALFHGVAGGGAALAATLFRGRYAGTYLIGFGVLDLYQAAASALGWFPDAVFDYSATDDLVHWLLGSFLIFLGGIGLGVRKKP